MGAEHKAEIERMKALLEQARAERGAETEEPIPDLYSTPTSRFGIGTPKLHREMFTHLQLERKRLMEHRARAMDPDDNRANAYIQPLQSKVAKQRMVTTTQMDNLHTTPSFRTAVQSAFCHPLSILKDLHGRTIHYTAKVNVKVDAFGDKIKNASAIPGPQGRLAFHNRLQSSLSNMLSDADIRHDGGVHSYDRTCARVFRDVVNIPDDDVEGNKKLRDGAKPDLITWATSVDRREPKGTGVDIGQHNTFIDIKTMGPTADYITAATDNEPGASVQSRQRKVSPKYRSTLRQADRDYNGTQPGEVGPAEARLDEFHRGLVSGPVVGPYGETSPDLDSILDTCSARIATKRGRFLDREPRVLKQLALQELRRDMLLTIDRGWSALIMNAIPSMTQDRPEHRRRSEAQRNCAQHHFFRRRR